MRPLRRTDAITLFAALFLVGCKGWVKTKVETKDWSADPLRGTVSIAANFDRLASKHPLLNDHRDELEKLQKSGGGHPVFARPEDLKLFTRYFTTTSTTRCQLKPMRDERFGIVAITLNDKRWIRETELRRETGSLNSLFTDASKLPAAVAIEYSSCTEHKVWVMRVERIPPGKRSKWYEVVEDSLRSAKLIDE